MCNTFIIIVSIFFSFLNSEESEKKEIPKLDLRDFNLTIDNIGFTKGIQNQITLFDKMFIYLLCDCFSIINVV